MSFTWPDPISFVADVFTIVGVPLLVIAFRAIFKEWKYEREHNIVSMGCMEFNNVDNRCGVNLVPLKNINAVPRVGDEVYLPGETHDGERYGTGRYSVLKIVFCYEEAPEVNQPCPALPVKVIVDVRKIEPLHAK